MTNPDCVFCDKIAAGDFEYTDNGCVVFEPLNPVTPGHLLVVPIEHASNAVVDPNAGRAVEVATTVMRMRHVRSANIITSVGAEATQSVLHTHIHIVPRREGDGLTLPWTGQEKENSHV
ncbi:histidine triad nucleotide binding protein [Gordonia phage RedWattleHog]|uniref:Histidine triad nucleotide binding protein n=1 Tax=Gordonia phage Stormageddon TaxID=2656541 RepID=A0A649VRB8_9CAUD|nr:histidine triad nucleotide binding protein [Gordonia phage Stormageddon]QGJ95016.1 histidine triad nucleotide binding protein [Gordonia phage Stormageddon]QLF83658.1 histidine triad nucleotide binding protein [Gordonia phage RedWattleHog]